ncbi:hypothetical protein CCH79_00015088 [Gambusia affinis]|uniref:Parvalbumin n=1 Tax=Gambusia affinis TaxID=33528 RepID=A0A315W9Q4_GAMAF|nr:hypothetical protein CCH79_00015088 [Gambusia affinis]
MATIQGSPELLLPLSAGVSAAVSRVRFRLKAALSHNFPTRLLQTSQQQLANTWWNRSHLFIQDMKIQRYLTLFCRQNAETFDPRKFFEMVGMKAMSAENVKKVFQVLDVDGSGFIEEEELKFVLKGFSKDGRDLTDAETKAFLTAADKDGDGKIGIDGPCCYMSESFIHDLQCVVLVHQGGGVGVTHLSFSAFSEFEALVHE